MCSSTYLKEPLQPPNLKDAFPKQHTQLKDTPPLDPPVRALGRISMRPLPNNNVRLLILDLTQQIRKMLYFRLQWIIRYFVFRHVYDAMYIEANLLATCRPVLVAEAVFKFTVLMGVEAVVTGGDAALVYEVLAGRVENLNTGRASISFGLINDPRNQCP